MLLQAKIAEKWYDFGLNNTCYNKQSSKDNIHKGRIPCDSIFNLALQPPTRDDSAEIHNSTQPNSAPLTPSPYFSNSTHKPFMQMLYIAYPLPLMSMEGVYFRKRRRERQINMRLD
ncbi:hypothetical protein CEXT_107601 [Caerostris extrusa]|uniref:Uncharacterized protein n=1 Tax=Caerostris extrusa TaxID=172846 RepID=A0AAV4TJ90_CAEEX|nr:hypothetical protein CEXT_107601 [Caerostris extrusa]